MALELSSSSDGEREILLLAEIIWDSLRSTGGPVQFSCTNAWRHPTATERRASSLSFGSDRESSLNGNARKSAHSASDTPPSSNTRSSVATELVKARANFPSTTSRRREDTGDVGPSFTSYWLSRSAVSAGVNSIGEASGELGKLWTEGESYQRRLF